MGRFTPTTWGDLSAGKLEVLKMGSGTSGPVTWTTVPDPSGATAYFTTKGDNRVWQRSA